MKIKRIKPIGLALGLDTQIVFEQRPPKIVTCEECGNEIEKCDFDHIDIDAQCIFDFLTGEIPFRTFDAVAEKVRLHKGWR